MSEVMLQKIAEREKTRAAKLASEWAGLVRDVAADKRVDDEHAAEVLVAAGKTFRDLEAAVYAVKQRQQLAARIATKPALEAEMAELKKKIESEEQKFKAAADEHRRTVWPWASRVQAIEVEFGEIRGAATALRQSAPEDLQINVRLATSELAEAGKALATIKDNMRKWTAEAEHADRQVGTGKYTDESLKESAETYRKRAARLQSEQAAAEARVVAATGRLHAADAALLDATAIQDRKSRPQTGRSYDGWEEIR